MGRRDAEARRIPIWSLHAPILLFGLCSFTPSSAQYPCDSSDYGGVGGDFDRIFGGKPEPWQVCGDTTKLNDLLVIYSFPQCRIWAEVKGSTKWSVDLDRFRACKVMVIRELVEEALRNWRRSDMVFQSADKRIFGLRSANGEITPIDKDDLPQ